MLRKIPFVLLFNLFFVPIIGLAGGPVEIRESTILFKIDPNATPKELKKLNALFNPSTVIESETLDSLKVHVVTFKNIQGFEKAFSEQLMSTGAVLYAEPDAIIPHATAPDDYFYDEQWHHPIINSPGAWDHLTGPTPVEAVKVCVLDTGVDTDHPDLAPNLLLPGYNTRLNAIGNVEDAHGHGTGTSGVVGAVGNNSIGVSGMAWNIRIIPVRINISDNNSSAYYSDMAQGIEYCADQGGKVANLSYGGAQSITISDAASYLRDAGGLLFMSAGNDGTYNPESSYPDYPSFVVVGATSQSDSITSFSETGPFVDIAAPGQSIATTYTNAQYVYYSGTSFSSPMAAGLAALVYSVNPAFSPADVENHIFTTAADLGDFGDDDVYGHGRIDAAAAVVSALGAEPNIPPTAVANANHTSGPAPLTVTFDGLGSSDEDGFIQSYAWEFGDGNEETVTVDPGESTHNYTEAGSFNAKLTVTDNASAQATSSVITIVVSPDPTVLLAPTDLSAAVDANTVTLNWNHNGLGGLQYFEIHRAKKRRGKYNYALVGTAPFDQREFVDQGLDLGDYRYKVRAHRDTDSHTDFSNTVSVKVESLSESDPGPDPDPGTLEPPVLSYALEQNQVILSWTHNCPEKSACTYSIDRGDSKSKGVINFQKVTEFPGSGNTYPIGDFEPGTYYYRVYAKTDGATSDFSNVVTVRRK